MWSSRFQKIAGLWKMINQGTVADLACQSSIKAPMRLFSVGSAQVDYPRKLKKHERKPMVTSMNELKRQARVAKRLRQNVQEITLRAPENGLLVRELVPVAHEVYATREELFACVSAVSERIPIYSCRYNKRKLLQDELFSTIVRFI